MASLMLLGEWSLAFGPKPNSIGPIESMTEAALNSDLEKFELHIYFTGRAKILGQQS